MKLILFSFFICIFSSISLGQIFTETMGSVGANTAISTHETNNGFDNDEFTMSGSGDLRNTSASTGYTGASGGANVFLTNNGTASFQIAGIATTGCSSLTLTFGAFKSTTASNMTELLLAYSIDGTNYINIPIPAQPTGSGTAIWRLITISLPIGAENQSNLRLRWTNSSTGPQFRIDDVSLAGNCSASNTITASNLSSIIYDVTCTTGAAGSIDFNSSGTFDVGNSFTAQLSDVSGSFSNPTNLPTSVSVSGNNPSGTLNFTIPAQTPTGTAYRIRIISSNPTAISDDNGTDINITLTETCIAPHVTSVIINSCNSLCSEGDNEILFGNTGDYSVDFNAANLDIYYGTSPSPTTNYTQTVHDNPSATEEFNLNAGCPGLFVDAYNTTVPANSSFLIANVDVCPLDVIDFTNLCGNGPIYVIYVDASAWLSAGNFANSTSCGSGGFRYFQSSITTTLNTNHVIDFYYECALNTGSDGDYAVWDENGGAAVLQGNNGCAFPTIVLPTELIRFTGENYGSQSLLNWIVASEHNNNNNYYSVYHSKDGNYFDLIAQVSGVGNANEELSYQFIHSRPVNGINYYKLTSTDFDGSTYFKGIVSVMINSLGTYFDPVTSELKFPEKGNYKIYSPEGKLLGNVEQSSSFPILNKGIVLIHHNESGVTERLFIP